MTSYQSKHLGEFIFLILDDQMFNCISGNFAGTPAELLEIFGVYCVPDYCVFMRIVNREEGIYIVWRNYGSNRIRINISKI